VFLIVLGENIKEMEKSNIMIRLEKKEEYQKVENLIRESFWNVYRP
jgi:putative acetyltransferase